jgi:glucokinase
MSDIYASVDLGGTKIGCVFATNNGRIVCEETIPTQSHQGPETVLYRIAELVCHLAKQSNHQPVALGMGVPGLADRVNTTTKFLPNLPTQWRDVAVGDILSPQIKCPVYLLNDVRMATLGELTFGHGRTATTMAFFALGTGIGGGIAVDGKLHLGPLGAAGELGHQTIIPDGPRCGCGNRGCLETLSSGPAITARGICLLQSGRAPKLYELVNGDCSRVTPKEMAIAAEEDEAVREELIRAAEYLGIGVSNVVTTLHPDLIILGGGVAETGPLLFETVKKTMQERVKMFPVDDIRIEPSLLGDKAGALGGIALAMKQGLITEEKIR